MRIRPSHPVLLATLVLVLFLVCSHSHPAKASPPGDDTSPPVYGATETGPGQEDMPETLQEARIQAQSMGSYRFEADVQQVLRPLPLPSMVGQTSQRLDMQLRGDVKLPGNVQIQLLIESPGLELPLIRIIQSGADTFMEVDGTLEPIDNPLTGVSPVSDYLAYLAAAENMQVLGITLVGGETFRGYSFDINGSRLAAHVREQLAAVAEASPVLSPLLNGMSGRGEIWVDADGLPRRQVLDLEMPEVTPGYDGRSHIEVEFSDFGRVSSLPQPVYDGNNGTWSLNETVVGEGGEAASFSAGATRSWTSPGASSTELSILLASGILLVSGVMLLKRTRRLQRATSIGLATVVLITPSLWVIASISILNHRVEAATSAVHQLTQLVENTVAQASMTGSTSPSPETALGSALTSASSAPGSRCGDGEPGVDTDGDGLDDRTENCLGTDPYDKDTDLDGIPDDLEVAGFEFDGATWPGDPLKPDSNLDGMIDTHEWPESEGGTAPSWDPDGDGIPNPWDPDNDGDGIPDDMDLAPFTTSGYQGSFEITSENRSPDGSYQYIEIQVQTEDLQHMQYRETWFDWPDDDKGNIQDLDGSTDDLRLTPVLEVQANVAPESGLARRYGFSIFPNEGDDAA